MAKRAGVGCAAIIAGFGVLRWLGLVLGAGAALAATPAYKAQVASTGPVLWYSFDEAAGNILNHGSGGAALDAAAFGSVTRGVPTAGGDPGMRFDQGDFLESLGASTLTGNPSFSIEALVRLDTGGPASFWGPFLHWGSGGATPTGKEVYFGVQNANNDRVYAGFYNAGVRTASPVSTARWVHVVWTRQGGGDSSAGSTVYVNGVAVAVQQDPNLFPGFIAAGQIAVTATPFRVNAGRDLPGQRFFSGTLDELALYSRVLTPAEVLALARKAVCPADINGDGAANFADVQAFVQGFVGMSALADINGDGAVNFADVQAFVTAFNAGC